jgi:hypothetical protein
MVHGQDNVESVLIDRLMEEGIGRERARYEDAILFSLYNDRFDDSDFLVTQMTRLTRMGV